jgi:hypothetical protein
MIGRNDCFRPGWDCLRYVVKEEQNAHPLVNDLRSKRGRMNAAQFHPRRALTTENSKGGFWVLGGTGWIGAPWLAGRTLVRQVLTA